MAYVVTPPTPQQVKVELDADPVGLGYAALEAAQDWNGLTATLNLVRPEAVIDRRAILISEMIEAIVFTELIAITAASRDALTLLFIATASASVDPFNPNVRGFLTGCFAAGTQTRSNLIALAEREGSRAEFLWGDGVVLTDALVEAAGEALMADVKLALASVVTMTVTNLHSLASSTTAGWQSAVVDNTSNLYLDALIQIILDFANTAPANSKGAYLFAYAGLETSYTNPASGSEGTITLLDVTANAQAMRQIGFIPYTTADEIVESPVFSVAAAFGGILPTKWGLALINHSGAALAGSGNTVKWTGVYATVTWMAVITAQRPMMKPPSGSVVSTNIGGGLWGVWDGLEGGGLVAIDGVKNRNGAVALQVIPGVGPFGPVWKFDGISSGVNAGLGSATSIHVSGPVPADWNFGTAPFSIEAWFRTSVPGSYRDILRYDGQTAGLIGLRITNTNLLDLLIADGTRAVSSVQTTGTTYTDGTWHHVVAARGNGLLYIYVDGQLKVSGSDRARNIQGAAGARALIGASYDPSPVAATLVEVWSGEISLLRVRRDVITTPAGVMQMYLNPWAIYQPPLIEQLIRLNVMAPPALSYTQEGFRWREDDGSETTATWLAAQDTNVSRDKEATTRLRLLTDTIGGDPPSEGVKLQYRRVGDPVWLDVS